MERSCMLLVWNENMLLDYNESAISAGIELLPACHTIELYEKSTDSTPQPGSTPLECDIDCILTIPAPPSLVAALHLRKEKLRCVLPKVDSIGFRDLALTKQGAHNPGYGLLTKHNLHQYIRKSLKKSLQD